MDSSVCAIEELHAAAAYLRLYPISLTQSMNILTAKLNNINDAAGK